MNTFLIVDDDLEMQRECRELLSPHGRVDVATRAREAVAYLQSKEYDMIVADIAPMGLEGIELLRVIRDHDLDVPIVLTASMPTLEMAMLALEYRALRYVTKPVDRETFAKVIVHHAVLRSLARVKSEAMRIVSEEASATGERRPLEVRFQSALSKLWIACQPIVSWRDHGVYGFEALVRTDEVSLASPVRLFEAAEHLGEVHTVGRIVRTLAASTANAMPTDAFLFVNLHPTDLLDDDLLDSSAPLSRVAPRVVLEITERSTLDNVKDLERRLRILRALGFRLAVDDLGAGYAGLTSLTLLEPEVVKLDMSLTRNVDASAKKRSVFRSMKQLCDDLGTLVITEGVETDAEREALTGIGCDLLQGYRFAKPARGFPAASW